MNLLGNIIALSAAVALLSGCASVRVLPSEGDVGWAVARAKDKHRAEKAAYRAAVNYCEDRGGEAVFVSDRVLYQGSMDEELRNTIRRQSQAASVLAEIAKQSDHEGAANVLTGASEVGSAATDGWDYKAEVGFKCRMPQLSSLSEW